MSRPSLTSLIERRAPLEVVAARLRDARLTERIHQSLWDGVTGKRSMDDAITDAWAAEVERMMLPSHLIGQPRDTRRVERGPRGT